MADTNDIFLKEDYMTKKIPVIGLNKTNWFNRGTGAAFFFCFLLMLSCDFPGSPPEEDLEEGQGRLTVNLPDVRNTRSVLPDEAIGGLVYKVRFTAGETIIERDVEGESISLALSAGTWSIAAESYNLGDIGGTLVGTGTGTETVVLDPGQHQSITISMYVDPDYEAGLTDIYIHNEAELRRIGAAADGLAIDDPGRTFHLENDIVLTEPWTPIGNSGTPFGAVFSGNGHTITISGFSDAALNGMYLGLFGGTNGAAIGDLTIVYNNLTASSSYSGSQWVGGLAGSATDTLISDVYVLGTVEYTASNALYIGGLVGGAGGASGSSTDTQISNSSFTGILKGTGAMTVNAGGILGSLNGSSDNAKIETSYATGIIKATTSSGDAYAGGIAGDGACSIGNCYSTAEIAASASSSAYAGGIIGQLSTGVMGFGKCYALGPVSAEGSTIYAGGIAGRSGSAIENCAALAEIDGNTGTNVGRVIGDFWNGTYSATNYAASDKAISRGSPGASAVDGITTYGISAFQGAGNQLKYETALSWVFDASSGWKWVTGYSYPVLEWQTEAPDVDLDNLDGIFIWP
jgi:hypothetical protein